MYGNQSVPFIAIRHDDVQLMVSCSQHGFIVPSSGITPCKTYTTTDLWMEMAISLIYSGYNVLDLTFRHIRNCSHTQYVSTLFACACVCVLCVPRHCNSDNCL